VRASTRKLLWGMALLCLGLSRAHAQEPPPVAAAGAPGLSTGPATVAAHWSKYDYPRSIPDGATYYIIVKGDTLWDIAKRFLHNAYLWPQIWDANRYIKDAHWIYPGDPLIIPNVAMVSERATETQRVTGEAPAAEAAAGAGAAGGPTEPRLFAVMEESALQCAPYVIDDPEDDSLSIIGSENGATKVAFVDRDAVYLSRGSNGGVKPGDLYTIHHVTYAVKHPDTHRTIGHKIETTGWLRVVLVQENAATAIIEHSCADIHAGDYLKPFAPVTVPMLPLRAPPTRLTPPTGKVDGAVVDIDRDAMIAANGQLIVLNLGARNGISPGSILLVYRIMYPSVPTPRVVLGEVVVVSVRERTSVAKVTYSADAIMNGDRVELR
jgi:hypothetical protein